MTVLRELPAPDAVHVWTADLDRRPPDYPRLYSLLDPAECARAERFVFDRDRFRYVVCRGLLRLILAQYLDEEPGAISFQYGARGKPSIRTTGRSVPLHFNVSHTAGVGVYAIASAAPVGVDVEWTGRAVAFADLAERFFAPEETAELLALPFVDRPGAFFSCWTRKEAYIKAIGDGLACPLDTFSVTLKPGDLVRFRSIGSSADEAARWSLRAFSPLPGYVGALALPAPIRSLDLRTWTPVDSAVDVCGSVTCLERSQ